MNLLVRRRALPHEQADRDCTSGQPSHTLEVRSVITSVKNRVLTIVVVAIEVEESDRRGD